MSITGFHDVRYPLALAFGAVGGPERRTEIVQLASGHEHRNAIWSGSRRRWDIGSAIQTLDELHTLITFFEARRGPLHGFRFRDFTDDRSCAPEQAPSALDQQIGDGDGVQTGFELTKLYGEVTRRIVKPVSGSVLVARDGVVSASGFVVDHDVGTVTFDAPPALGEVITAGFQFDCPVRFDSDRIEASLEGFGAGRIVNVQIIELKG